MALLFIPEWDFEGDGFLASQFEQQRITRNNALEINNSLSHIRPPPI